MKKMLFLGMSFIFALPSAMAVNLLDVYRQAMKNDPVFKMALAKYREESEALPKSRSQILPQVYFSSRVGKARTKYDVDNSLTSFLPDGQMTLKQRNVSYDVKLTQYILNMSDWLKVKSASHAVKAAFAAYTFAAQDLIERTVNAYFSVLQAEEILRFSKAEKEALKSEYHKADQSFKVGIKTITDVYNAKAAYDSSIAEYVTAKNALENAKEDVRVITGVWYERLDGLKSNVTLNTPDPKDIDQWVRVAIEHNWKWIEATHLALAARAEMASAHATRLPTIGALVAYDYDDVTLSNVGYEKQKGPSVGLELNVPLFSGGAITSDVRQKNAAYQLALYQKEHIYRSVLNDTRKSYLGVSRDIRKAEADKQAIISNKSSLKGMREGYKVGVRTIVDVLNAEKSLYGSQKNYAIDRYDYIRDSIHLKLSTGLLSEQDLIAINQWLVPSPPGK